MSAAVSFLIAEDDDLVGRSLQRALGQHGRTSLVTTIDDARTALAAETFSAVVVDVGLPDGSGLDLIPHARCQDPTLPALVLSGQVDASRLAEAHLLGAHYLLKPVDTTQLGLFALRTRARVRERQTRIENVVQRWSYEYQLTAAEAAVLSLAAHGAPRGMLAALRDVAPSTVKKQVHIILDKTGDASLDAAVSRLLRGVLDDS
ncbi:MAG: response regulator transcription factor [Deltaproteobacteria bacterium]|nr:response regulator transcription factor [Deltaproteobacteria bacterium]